jgi:hypothetical protein
MHALTYTTVVIEIMWQVLGAGIRTIHEKMDWFMSWEVCHTHRSNSPPPPPPRAHSHTDDPDADPSWIQKALLGPGSHLALAILCSKVMIPIKLPIALAITPYVYR